jgi:transmembrane sensor
MSTHPHSRQDPIEEQASAWVARRDRGLTPDEQDKYLQWLAADPRHLEELQRQAAAFQRMMMLSEWQPVSSVEPNPDLFARGRRNRWRTVLAIAAAFALVASLGWIALRNRSYTVPPSSYLVLNERLTLPDGSVAELKEDSHLTVDFRSAERRVRLTGEALFHVAKNAKRPFIVEAGGVAVRAVGTAFNVRVGEKSVDVLVTEGSVRVHPQGASAALASATEVSPEAATLVGARQRVIVDRSATVPPAAKQITADEIAIELAWKAPRFQFTETPLETAVDEFNRRNSQKIFLKDPSLRSAPIGGTFRADNVEAFVRAVEVTLDVHAEHHGDEIILTRAR